MKTVHIGIAEDLYQVLGPVMVQRLASVATNAQNQAMLDQLGNWVGVSGRGCIDHANKMRTLYAESTEILSHPRAVHALAFTNSLYEGFV
ncbi:hypothetical protein GCM10011385_00340 [Nitratireductor aestuarii]|uniref:Uncharacterized protein n=1 Tax=Nitratireductor aestuarii TaxID=1735103 RepID=A0A916RBX9_9HYPH|nr:hypothetical protein GCM10011385_00340 [Nitratireductor aestuarii]